MIGELGIERSLLYELVLGGGGGATLDPLHRRGLGALERGQAADAPVQLGLEALVLGVLLLTGVLLPGQRSGFWRRKHFVFLGFFA